MVFTFLTLFDLLVVSSHVTDFSARNKILIGNFSNRAIGIINFGNLIQNFITDTMNWFQNKRTD